MEVDAAKLVWDAQQALLRIERFIQGRDFAAYQCDELLRSAVERQFEILGEALNQLPVSMRILPGRFRNCPAS